MPNGIFPEQAAKEARERRRGQGSQNGQSNGQTLDQQTRAKIEQSIRKVDDPDAQRALELLLQAVDE